MKFEVGFFCFQFCESHPVRGAWIEILSTGGVIHAITSHPVRGAWIEIALKAALGAAQIRRTP